jgi:hypothetical protein
VALLGGVPLFLCLPPWNDVTLHDMAARAILRGGVHYQAVFDTNLPGIDWAMAGIRAMFGRSYEVLRAFDLLVVGTAVAMLAVWVQRIGASKAIVAWFLTAAALFYPFTSEFNHVQRDPWMFLPAVVAAWWRLQTAERARFALWRSVAEGFLWGVAVWFKPHVILPALAVWGVSTIFLKRRQHPLRQDLLALLGGGVLAGLPGVAWLVGTGAWPHFVDVFTNWNPDYVADGLSKMAGRVTLLWDCFRPWSLANLVAIPVAIAWLWKRANASRCILAALYLAFLFQGIVIQKGFDYVHVAPTLLALAIVSAAGWCVGFAAVVYLILAAVLVSVVPSLRGTPIEQHRLLSPAVMQHWPRCWREGSSAALRDQLGVYTHIHVGTTWEDLERVAAFLRSLEPPLGDRELTCWHDSTHSLYLMLNLEPSTRYMHFGTALDIRKQAPRIAAEVAASPQRYVVSDLRRMTWDPVAPLHIDEPLKLPGWFPRSQRGVFPWNQPIVFRSGRYLVHKMTGPVGVIDIPAWLSLNQLGPGE